MTIEDPLITLPWVMRKKKELPRVEPVVLPTIKGIRPGKYILWLLVAAIILIIFTVLYLPGIVKGGRHVDFSSPLSGVGVIVDGKYTTSTTAGHVFIESGKHEVEYIKDGITIAEGMLEIDHPVFATLFVRRSMDVTVLPENTEGLYEAIVDRTVSSLAAYCGIQDWPEGYNYPPLLENFANDVVALGLGDVSGAFHLMSQFVTSPVMLDDLVKAEAILDASSVSYRAVDTATIEDLLAGNANADSGNAIVPDSAPEPTADGWFRYKATTLTLGDGQSLSMESVSSAPVTVETEAFEMAPGYVSQHDWALFVQENPYWAPENINRLMADGVADQYYLAGITLSTLYDNPSPVRNISWYAADAYCKWLSSKEGVTYRMPTEAEWTLAALCAQDEGYATTLYAQGSGKNPASLLGGLWEFTDTAYVPLSRIEGLVYSASDVPQADIIVKGGSYLNASDGIDANTVGVMQRSVTSDYAGLRLVREGQ